jgi:hypothetical protein
MFEELLARCVIADRIREAEWCHSQQALLAEVRARPAEAGQPVRRRVAAWVGERLIRLGAYLGAASATLTPWHP